MGYAQGGQDVLCTAGGELLQADSASAGADRVGPSAGSASTLPEDDGGQCVGASLSCRHNLSTADQCGLADAGLVRGSIRQTAGRGRRLGTATSQRNSSAMDRGHRHDLPFDVVGADGKPPCHVETKEPRASNDLSARLPDGTGVDRPRRTASAAAKELLQERLLSQAQTTFSHDDPTGGGDDSRVASASRRGRGSDFRQRLRCRRDPQGVAETSFSRSFPAGSESGACPHAGARLGVDLRRQGSGVGAALAAEEVCPVGTRDGQRRPRLRAVGDTPTTCESRKRSGDTPQRRAKRRSPNWETA